jgi:hypothetical protein
MKIQNDNQTPVPLLGNDNGNYKNVLLDLIASKGNMNEGNSNLTQLITNPNGAIEHMQEINSVLLSHEESIKVESEVSDFVGSPVEEHMHTIGKMDDFVGQIPIKSKNNGDLNKIALNDFSRRIPGSQFDPNDDDINNCDAKRASGLPAVFSASNNEWDDERIKQFEAHLVTKRLAEEPHHIPGTKLMMQGADKDQ